MSTPSVNRDVNVFIETGEAQQAYDRLIAKQKKFTDELKTATDPTRIKTLNKELGKLEEPISRASKKLSGELKPSLTDLGNTVKKLSAELRTMSANDPNFEKKVLQLRQANSAYTQQLNTIRSLNKEHDGLLGKFGNFAKELVAPIAGLFALEKGIELIASSIEAAIEQEQNIARFRATLENVGRSDVFDRLSKSASRFADEFKTIQDDDILPIFTKLIDYGKLTEKQITTLTPIIINFAAKQRISLGEATDVITKGLEGSAKALKTYGINLSDAKTESERFAIITEQLGKKVEGAAAAFAETTEGKIAQNKKAFTELKEEIGNGLIPVLNTLLDTVKFVGIGIQDVSSRIGNALLKIYNPTQYALKKATEALEEINNNASDYANTLAPILGKLDDADLTTRLIRATADIDRIKKLLKSRNQLFDEADRDLLVQSLANNEKLIEQIRIEQDDRANRTLGIDAGSTKAPKAKSKDFDLDSEEQKLLDRIQKALAENKDIFTKKITDINIQLDDLLRGAEKKLKEYLLNENTTLAQRNAAQAEFNQLSVDIEKQRWVEIQLQLEEAEKTYLQAIKNRNTRLVAEEAKMHKSRLEAFIVQQNQIAELLAKQAKLELGDLTAGAELKVIQTKGKAQLAAKKEQLKLQEEIELGAEDAIGKKRELIKAKYKKAIDDLEDQELQRTVEQYAQFIQSLTTALESFYNISNAKAQAEIDADNKINERKKKNFQAQLDGKVITQREYNKKVDELDKQVEAKERALRIRQFKQNQITSIANASINVAEAVTKALTAGPVSGQIIAGFTAALGAIQIALIATQKPPSYGKGGLLDGPLHSEGGMPIINPRTGKKVAEIEGGEAILSRSTVRNNPGLVSSLLHSSMHRGGASINTSWRNSPMNYMNFAGIQQSMNRVRYATGGVFNSSQQGLDQADLVAAIAQMNYTVDNLNQQLAQGIRAHTVLTELNSQQERLQNLKADARG